MISRPIANGCSKHSNKTTQRISRNLYASDDFGTCGGVDGIWGGEDFESSELGELGDDLFWLGQNRDGVRLEAGAGSVAGFELATEDEGWEGEFLFWQAERGASPCLTLFAPKASRSRGKGR